MMQLGFNMAGTEVEFEKMLRISMAAEPFRSFQYLEIGVAHGDTLIAVSKWCRKHAGPHSCSGVDIEGCEFFEPSFFFDNCPRPFIVRSTGGFYPADINSTGLCFLDEKRKSSRYLLGWGPYNFCLIDGCHGKNCVKADFLNVESEICPGGIVAFHDAGEEDQGHGFQPHCGEPINVRAALKELGLLDGSRGGWELVCEAHGDKSKSGNGFVFVRKTDQNESNRNND